MNLPDFWEMLQFSKDPEIGRCAFADKYQFRFEINWRRIPGPPDMARLFSDYKSRLLENKAEDIQEIFHQNWRGLSAREGKQSIFRYGTYLTSPSMLLEAVFLHPHNEDVPSSIDTGILDSICIESPSQPESRTWEAFGMKWQPAPGLALLQCQCSCGLAEAVFQSPDERIRQVFSRRGMLSTWLKMPLEQWLQRQLPPAFKITSMASSPHATHNGFELTAVPRRPVLSDWLHGRRLFQASAFICPKDGRLFFLSSLSQTKSSTTASLSCSCGAMLQTGGNE